MGRWECLAPTPWYLILQGIVSFSADVMLRKEVTGYLCRLGTPRALSRCRSSRTASCLVSKQKVDITTYLLLNCDIFGEELTVLLSAIDVVVF